MAKYLGQVW